MITPVILCGGSGTRLWPLSRKSYPKQFAPLMEEQSLFQASAERLSGEEYSPPLILTNSDFRFIVTEQLTASGIDPGTIIIEPEGRNTAPAILAAALQLQSNDPNSIMLVAPSDHVVPNPAAFRKAVDHGLSAAKSGKIVTFGITPTHPDTGYGYLELSTSSTSEDNAPVPLTRFVEKPDAERAQDMLDAGNFMWNAGIFLFSTKAIIDAFDVHCPGMIAPVSAAVSGAQPDLGFLRLAPEPWAEAESISIDYAVMEKADNLAVVPFSQGWSDLGGWDAVWRESPKDDAGVATFGQATAIDCSDTLLRSEDDGLQVVGLGLKNIVAIAMPDAVLVADAARAQDVKKVVDTLKIKNIRQAESFPRDHRPWGFFDSLAMGDRFQVKRIVVNPGAALSLQSHHHRAEHWIVVEGTAEVTIGDDVKLVSENESVYVPLGAVHRLANPGKVPVAMIEVQTGTYLGEDDIIRYEDVYSRG
ncbi:MAG: mannose-1-phosphate guanylyltransferase/mannose-6-phosphate isomerase [Rhizobiaceae bacterium]|nr:mannose-1-phosphate guanylyltransferase/mannose-6-phosphate isomerase [Rhizobiaceae bacterium]